MKAYCLECGDIKEVKVKSQRVVETFQGVEVEYEAQVAYCEDCGEELYVGELFDKNLTELYKAYQEACNSSYEQKL